MIGRSDASLSNHSRKPKARWSVLTPVSSATVRALSRIFANCRSSTSGKASAWNSTAARAWVATDPAGLGRKSKDGSMPSRAARSATAVGAGPFRTGMSRDALTLSRRPRSSAAAFADAISSPDSAARSWTWRSSVSLAASSAARKRGCRSSSGSSSGAGSGRRLSALPSPRWANRASTWPSTARTCTLVPVARPCGNETRGLRAVRSNSRERSCLRDAAAASRRAATRIGTSIV